MKLESISIKNLRSLVTAQDFNLCPLTLVVGANSSGKSTFIRSFPLFRQSVETITKGPILWFGRFVDFGVFKDVVTRDIDIPEIEFSFSVNLAKNLKDNAHSYYMPSLVILDDTKVKVTLVIAEDFGTSNTYTKRIKINILEREIEINALADGSVQSFLLDGQPLSTGPNTELTINAGASLFSLSVSQKETSSKRVFEAPWTRRTRWDAFSDHVVRHVDNLFHGSTKRNTKESFIRYMGLGSCVSLTAQVKRLSSITPTSESRAKGYKSDSPWIKKLQGLVLADRTPKLLAEIDNFLAATFRSVNYIAPLRATAERFYRHQDLAVDEVDPQGANLAMFLMGLKPNEREEFSSWCQKNIGFSVEAKPVGAHVSINLRDSADGGLFNVADMGFGYSQLLPVLATMWRALTTKPTFFSEEYNVRIRGMNEGGGPESLPKIIAIEQPELHLHPRLQGKLADLLCTMALEGVESKANFHFICETHSETIINRIGELVAKGKIPSNYVQVLVFEKVDSSGETVIRKSEYGKDGILLNWPYGFFLPEED